MYSAPSETITIRAGATANLSSTNKKVKTVCMYASFRPANRINLVCNLSAVNYSLDQVHGHKTLPPIFRIELTDCLPYLRHLSSDLVTIVNPKEPALLLSAISQQIDRAMKDLNYVPQTAFSLEIYSSNLLPLITASRERDLRNLLLTTDSA